MEFSDIVIYKREKQAKTKYKPHGDDGSNGGNRHQEARMYIYIVLHISGSSS
jgi:hypothetical protein